MEIEDYSIEVHDGFVILAWLDTEGKTMGVKAPIALMEEIIADIQRTIARSRT